MALARRLACRAFGGAHAGRLLRGPRPAGLAQLGPAPDVSGRRRVGTSMLIVRVPSAVGGEIAVVDLLRFIHDEIHGPSAHFMESVSEISEVMDHLDFSPGATVLMDDAKLMVEHMGASPELLEAFVVREGSQELESLYCHQCEMWYMSKEPADGPHGSGPVSTAWTGGCRGHCGIGVGLPGRGAPEGASRR